MSQIQNFDDVLTVIKEQNNELMNKINVLVKKNRSNSDLSQLNLQNNKILEDSFIQNFRKQYEQKQQPRKFKVDGDKVQLLKEQSYVQKIKSITNSLNIYNVEIKELEKRLKDKLATLKQLQ